jgi:hypothetical protein
MAEEKKGMSKGCMIALIIVAILVVIVIVGGILIYMYRGEIAEFGLGTLAETIATEIKNNLPEGYTAEDVDRIVADFKQAIKDKKIDQGEIQSIGNLFQEVFEDKQIDQEEAKEILETIEDAIED